MRIAKDTTLPQETLFDAFKASLVEGKSVPLKAPDGSIVSKKVFIDDQDAGVVEIGKQHLRYGFVGLLHPKLSERRKYLARYLEQNTLSADIRAQLQTGVTSRARPYDNVLKEMIVLGTSPQNHQTIVTEKLNRQRLNIGDLIPDDIRFWENLAALSQVSLFKRILRQRNETRTREPNGIQRQSGYLGGLPCILRTWHRSNWISSDAIRRRRVCHSTARIDFL